MDPRLLARDPPGLPRLRPPRGDHAARLLSGLPERGLLPLRQRRALQAASVVAELPRGALRPTQPSSQGGSRAAQRADPADAEGPQPRSDPRLRSGPGGDRSLLAARAAPSSGRQPGLGRTPAAIGRDTKFAFIGRLPGEKGADLVALGAREAGVPAMFVGDGPLAAEIRSIDPQAELLGWQSAEEVDRL